jgi:hypothetical protein
VFFGAAWPVEGEFHCSTNCTSPARPAELALSCSTTIPAARSSEPGHGCDAAGEATGDGAEELAGDGITLGDADGTGLLVEGPLVGCGVAAC